MSMFMPYVLLLLTTLLTSVSALPLTARDVVDPPVTSPTAGTIWHVGQTQTVTWNATGLPVNQSNPVGMLVLGYLYNNSEHLMLDSPLATNLNYSVGQAQVTVPNVPTRSDYIVVLFGDSGNASPEFTIINDASSSTSVAPPPASTIPQDSSSPTAPAPTATSPPGNLGPGPASHGGSSSEPMAASPATVATGTTATTTASHGQTTNSHTSTTVVVTASNTPSPTQSSAAWHKHVPSLPTSLTTALAVIYFVFS